VSWEHLERLEAVGRRELAEHLEHRELAAVLEFRDLLAVSVLLETPVQSEDLE